METLYPSVTRLYIRTDRLYLPSPFPGLKIPLPIFPSLSLQRYILVCVRRCPIRQCYILQGSTSVYSRKVEHVHQLVLRTIDFLMQQKHQNGGGGGGSKGSIGNEDMKEGEDVSAMREPWCSSLCD